MPDSAQPHGLWSVRLIYVCIYIYVYIYIYMGCAESSYCMGFSLVVASGGYSLVVMHRLLIVATSLVAEHGH